MDRIGWIAVIIATVGLLASMYWQQQKMTEARAKYLQQQALLAAQATPSAAPLSQRPSPVAPTPAASPAKELSAKVSPVPDQVATLKSSVAELQFSNNRGGLSTVSLLKHSAEQGNFVRLNTDRTTAIGAITQNPRDWRDSGYELSTDPDSGTATLKRTTAEGLEITKVYTLAKQAGF